MGAIFSTFWERGNGHWYLFQISLGIGFRDYSCIDPKKRADTKPEKHTYRHFCKIDVYQSKYLLFSKRTRHFLNSYKLNILALFGVFWQPCSLIAVSCPICSDKISINFQHQKHVNYKSIHYYSMRQSNQFMSG